MADSEPCVAAMVLAFSTDPGVRWMYPNPHQYVESFPRFVRAFGGRAFEHGTAHYVEGFLAAALWLSPGVHPDEEALMALIEDSVPADRRGEIHSLFEQMDGYHPAGAHWHLPLIGADPSHRGRGHGSALLNHALAICDQQQLPAYLEATSERSVPLYQKHGFEVLGTIQAGTSPPLTPMLRNPR